MNYSQLLIHKNNIVTLNLYFIFNTIFYQHDYVKEDSFYFELNLFNLYGVILSNRFDGKHLYWRFKWSYC